VARNVGLVLMMGESLGYGAVVLPEVQLTGTVGAVLIAREMNA
jgi:activator of 2-hydroxyglutaryl-CoA dehydratase